MVRLVLDRYNYIKRDLEQISSLKTELWQDLVINKFKEISSFRITGAKGDKNIHATVSEQLKKNFAKSRWKVEIIVIRRWWWYDIMLLKISISRCKEKDPTP